MPQSTTTTNQPTYVNPTSQFQIEGFYLTRLNIGFVPPKEPGEEPTQYRSAFDFNFNIHNVEKNRYKLNLHFTIEELSEEGNPLARNALADIVGFFSFNPPEEKAKMDNHVLLNGISTLYGMLRGFIAMATGCFPGKHPLLLPCQLPHEIVALVESNRKKGSSKSSGPLDRTQPEQPIMARRETTTSSTVP